MRCERLSKCLIVFAFVAAACGREQPAPQPPATETHAAPQPQITATHVDAAPALHASYDKAMDWLRSVPRFRFVIDEGGVRAEGTMTRPTVGAEKIEFRSNGDEWRAEAGPQGITWQKHKGNAWVAAAAPEYGNHLYQRVTLVFDPMKKEGAAKLVPGEPAATASLFRFTDANTGNVHEVWVSNAGNHVERIRIAGVMDLTIQP